MAKQVHARGVRSQAIRDYLAHNPNAASRQVVADLRKARIDVTEGLVNNIKYGGKKRAGGARSAKSAAPGQPPSRSQHIRDYLAQNKTASPKEIVNALKEKGIEVTVGLASLIKYSAKKDGGRRRGATLRRSGSAGAAWHSTGALSASDLIEAKKLVDGLGGISAARQALEVLEQLR